MFYLLLLVTFLVALLDSYIVIKFFRGTIKNILEIIAPEKMSQAWVKYINFAIYVVGVSGGIRIREIEKYITSPHREREATVLTMERWTLEIYRTLIDSLSSIAWLLLIFFIFTLVAYVVIRIFEGRK